MHCSTPGFPVLYYLPEFAGETGEHGSCLQIQPPRTAPQKGQAGAKVNHVGVEVRTLGFKSLLRHLLVMDLQ